MARQVYLQWRDWLGRIKAKPMCECLMSSEGGCQPCRSALSDPWKVVVMVVGRFPEGWRKGDASSVCRCRGGAARRSCGLPLPPPPQELMEH